jgi:hypothetical protein
MTRDEAIGYHKTVHNLSKSHLNAIKKLDPATKQIWLANLVYTLGDLMYKETGVEPQELDC